MSEEVIIKAEAPESTEPTVVVVQPEATGSNDSFEIGTRLGKLESSLEEFKKVIDELGYKISNAQWTADDAITTANTAVDIAVESTEVAEEAVEVAVDTSAETMVEIPVEPVQEVIPETLKKPELLSFRMPWSKREETK